MLLQLLLVAASVVALGFASRWAKLEVARVERQMNRLQKILLRVQDEPIKQLRLDQDTGIYLPANQ